MKPFEYARPTTTDEAVALVAGHPNAAFLAGGTTEVDLLRLGVAQADLLVDINHLPLYDIEDTEGGGLRIGALARMSQVADAPSVRERFPLVAQALELGASAQLRHMASMGGNMLQRTRCPYFRNPLSPCNKREPGSGCPALEGVNRNHAVLGTSEHCIAAHPSDVAVVLVALDTVVHIQGSGGERSLALDDFFLLPGEHPEREHPLEPGDLIVALEVPAVDARNSTYLKVRDRESYEFALTSAAASLRVEDGVISDIRLALGGVGTKPWRARKAEAALQGAPATQKSYEAAAEAELEGAVGHGMNNFKIDLARRTIVRVLSQLAEEVAA